MTDVKAELERAFSLDGVLPFSNQWDGAILDAYQRVRDRVDDVMVCATLEWWTFVRGEVE